MTVPDIFLLMSPFLLIIMGETVNPRGAGVAFYLMAAFSSFAGVAYPQLSAATSTSSTEYTTGMLYLAIGFAAAVLAIVSAITIEKGGRSE